MDINLEIKRSGGNDTQVKCKLSEHLMPEFYSFGEIYTDEQIKSLIKEDLAERGYDLTRIKIGGVK